MIGIYDTPDAYICNRCGHVLEPKETSLSYDDMLTCGMCGSEDVEEAYRCEICDELHPESDIYAGDHKVCRHCLEKKRYDLDFCAKVGEPDYDPYDSRKERPAFMADGSEVVLNEFLAQYFTEQEINELMLSALKERAKFNPIDGWDFLKSEHMIAADALFEAENG